MLRLMREWGVPAGMLVAWSVAAAYTLHSLGTMQQLPVVYAPAVIITAPANGS